MAKQPKKSSTTGQRNDKRRSGKKFGLYHGVGDAGHRETGRTKPSGKSVGGHSLAKIEKLGLSVDEISKSRNTQHRAELRWERKVAASRQPSAKK